MLPETGLSDWPTPLQSHLLIVRDDDPLRPETTMATTPTSHEHHTAPSDLPTLLASWRRHLAAQRLGPGNPGHLLGGGG